MIGTLARYHCEIGASQVFFIIMILEHFRAAQRALEQKKKDEEKRKYQETLKDAEIQDREFRKRSDSERRKRLMV